MRKQSTDVGMNYYAVVGRCPTCSHPRSRWHICKNFSTFRSWAYDGPFDLQINEFKHWEEVLGNRHVQVVDDYNELVDKDVFLQICRSEGPKRDLDWDGHNRGYKRDPEGFVFYSGEFS